MQLVRALVIVAVAAAGAGTAAADGEVTVRGAYYKEASTRVQQPMVDALFEVGEAGTLRAHALVDAITSASVASGADQAPFSELRYEFGAGYTHELERIRLDGSTRFSYEPDYTSLFGGARGEVELAEKNFVIGFGGSLGHDWVSNAGAQNPLAPPITGTLTTALGSLSVSQLISPEAVASLTYDLAYLDGFQQNPYRTAITDIGLVPERHPETRLRHAIAGSARYYIKPTRTTAIAAYRFYTDDWGVQAHTPEVRAVQEAGQGIELGLRYRYYTQNAADFYAERYMGTEAFLTDDPKLSAFRSHTFEGKVGVLGGVFGLPGRWQDARFDVLLAYVDTDSDFRNAIVAQAALTLPFAY
jgi:hypothetical protein